MIRVFPRKTNFTPTDDLAFFDEPPLFELPKMDVYISVTFTWDIEKGYRLYRAWKKSNRFPFVDIGGPALDRFPPKEFVSGRFLKKGVTITSRGCPKRCEWCLASKREGPICELPIVPGHIIQDNNILACSKPHFENVCEMLKGQKTIQFKGGLDVDYMEAWHVEQLKKLGIDELWVACDTSAALKRLDKAVDLLSDFSIDKKRCYVMVGFNGETQDQARLRCLAVLRKGFKPFAQLYRGPDLKKNTTADWHDFCFYWTHPQYYMTELL